MSQNERKAFKLTFNDRPTIIQGPNGFGKSALLKSLYEVFAAVPHKIDSHWKEARVYILVNFSIDELHYKILKAGDVYAVFDFEDKVLIRTTEVTKELSPYLAKIFHFCLTAVDQNGSTVTPPPAYIFAPYYVDQDKSWSTAWASFIKMYLPRSASLLADYHSGTRPNEYYIAQSDRDKLAQELKQVEQQRTVADKTLTYIRSIGGDVVLTYDAKIFEHETLNLVNQSIALSRKQTIIRDRFGKSANERQVWSEQISVIKAAIVDSKSALFKAVKRPDHINCPTCGHEYENSIAEQFGLVENQDQLALALIYAQEKHRRCETTINQLSENLGDLREEISSIESILETKRSDIKLGDVILSEGRRETSNYIINEIYKNDAEIGKLTKAVADATAKMNRATSKKKAREIKDFFIEKIRGFAELLDVRLGVGAVRLDAPVGGRGSEGPRSMITYYYAFLHTAHRYTSSTYCPIVIDAPNQQGQDKEHIAQVVDFIVKQKPSESQLILGVEDVFDIKNKEVDIVILDGPRDHLLKETNYDDVATIMRPYLANLL